MNAARAHPPLPPLTRSQVRRVDRIAIEELGYPGVVLMENAGRNAADFIEERARARGADEVVIFAGPGNNGGDGFVIARHLRHRGLEVRVFLASPRPKLRGDAATNAEILHRLGFPLPELGDEGAVHAAIESLGPRSLLVDGLLGTGFHGEVRPALARLIDQLNHAARCELIALDIPSGLDCDTGSPSNATIRADHTVTFAAPKVGFTRPPAADYTGDVILAGIGVPDELITRTASEP